MKNWNNSMADGSKKRDINRINFDFLRNINMK